MHIDNFNLEHIKVIWGHSKLARNSKNGSSKNEMDKNSAFGEYM